MRRASRWIAGRAIHVDSGSSFKHSMARSVGSLPRSDTSGVGGEADMPRQPNRRD